MTRLPDTRHNLSQTAYPGIKQGKDGAPTARLTEKAAKYAFAVGLVAVLAVAAAKAETPDGPVDNRVDFAPETVHVERVAQADDTINGIAENAVANSWLEASTSPTIKITPADAARFLSEEHPEDGILLEGEKVSGDVPINYDHSDIPGYDTQESKNPNFQNSGTGENGQTVYYSK